MFANYHTHTFRCQHASFPKEIRTWVSVVILYPQQEFFAQQNNGCAKKSSLHKFSLF